MSITSDRRWRLLVVRRIPFSCDVLTDYDVIKIRGYRASTIDEDEGSFHRRWNGSRVADGVVDEARDDCS